ncbi:MAG: cobalt-precorrin 5A hydrolase [Methanomicrobiales archaeon]|jgi:cobalt-precorrin 5A hydrolase|nr:cobalt-precorrin 5A hydrolase [Methanomicrobiales archaeon]
MTPIAVTSLPTFVTLATRIASFLDADFVPYQESKFTELFGERESVVAVMAVGIVVRKIAPLLRDKWHDPAVVVVSPDGKFVIPLIGGHHGANALARKLGGLGLIPVITTATEAVGRPSVEGIAAATGTEVLTRDATRPVNAASLEGTIGVYVVKGPAVVIGDPGVAFLARRGRYSIGLGCRKGTSASEVEEAVKSACSMAGIDPGEVAVYATTSRKTTDPGLTEAVQRLGGVLLYLDDATLNTKSGPTPSRASILGLGGVAEPSALITSKLGELVLAKVVIGRVTVAIAA